ncbi:hypothetical protein CFOL_v3_29259 [Cephalotus follicularis]|uniref:Uncharacterized protein n=1 Tax=Cephalotus follicularis TaxID=3775 RepID=A0A1Q3D079_CEPFO|nr:hypothetical protein CFOL_v3_29259 [Cephalotus follicularis]
MSKCSSLCWCENLHLLGYVDKMFCRYKRPKFMGSGLFSRSIGMGSELALILLLQKTKFTVCFWFANMLDDIMDLHGFFVLTSELVFQLTFLWLGSSFAVVLYKYRN